MSLKAKLKVFAGILLIPAVIICALISFEHSILGVLLFQDKLMGPTAYFDALSRNRNTVFWSFQRYTPNEKLILYGDKSKKNKIEQQRAIWEQFPENKMYFANYIINLLARINKKSNWQEKIFTELKPARKIDPDNALYNYITAGLLLKKACKIKSKRIHIPKKDRKDRKSYRTEYSLEIKDRNLMNQAVEEYLKGTRKKHFKGYTVEILHKRLDIIGQPKNVFENMNQIAMSAGTILPYMNYLRNIPKSLWLYAETLQKEGKQQEALRIISPWKTYIKQITENSDYLIGVLVNAAVAAIGEQKIPEIYRKAGKIKLAENVKQKLISIGSPVKKWKAGIKKYDITREQLAKAGTLATILLPALGKIGYTEEDFAISNEIEYTAIEKSIIILLNLLFLIGMTGGLLTAFYWKIRTKQKAVLLAPPSRLIGKVFLLGIILPLTVYILISISGIVGGHEYNLMHNAISLGAQFIILLTIIPATVFILIRKYVHQRCLEISVSCPNIKQNKKCQIILIIIYSIFILIALLPIQISPQSSLPESLLLSAIILGSIPTVFLVSYIVILVVRYFTTIFSGKQYALYYGALAKTLTPIFALAMIFMTLIIIPYLDWREADLISKDKIMYGQPKSFTHAEYRVVQRLKAAMLKALE